eukprot:TRINITY_DN9197_c0_g1_i1.p1 TRINITY_DN9197_c0_g1~~TRINITY_DN9197_c0_g1_i1.p1  ORF type:complete len:189 (+),score=15.79 TRINITY_DN9197_c0_g1_i1:42-569(+)
MADEVASLSDEQRDAVRATLQNAAALLRVFSRHLRAYASPSDIEACDRLNQLARKFEQFYRTLGGNMAVFTDHEIGLAQCLGMGTTFATRDDLLELILWQLDRTTMSWILGIANNTTTHGWLRQKAIHAWQHSTAAALADCLAALRKQKVTKTAPVKRQSVVSALLSRLWSTAGR